MGTAPPTGPVARTPRHSPRGSRGASTRSMQHGSPGGSPDGPLGRDSPRSAPVPGRWTRLGWRVVCHNPAVRFLRMRPGHGEMLIAEGDLELAEDEERLIEEFRRQLDA